MENRIYPMLFRPALKHYLWGGRNLAEKLGRELPDGVVAESWEIAAHPDGESLAENGVFADKTLTEVHQILGVDLIGHNCQWAQQRGKFPVLVKLLDAQRPLSVQVHPDDDYAMVHEGNELGKTEMWVVLHAEKHARIILGVRKGTSPALFKQAVEDSALEDFLHYLPVRTGDHICVPAGSLHAILGGVIIAEIQQNSNLTYRVYDWNRVDAGGRPRQLHLTRALEVINFDQVEPKHAVAKVLDEGRGVKRDLLCRNKYFTVERLRISAGQRFSGENDGDTFEVWGVVNGNATLSAGAHRITISAVRFVLLPATLGPFVVHAELGATLLRTYVETS